MVGAGEVWRQDITLMPAVVESLGGLGGGGGKGGEEAGQGHGQAHRPGNTHHITSLALTPGNLKTHQCHLLQVYLQHITVTSCRYLYITSLPPPSAYSPFCLLILDLHHPGTPYLLWTSLTAENPTHL